jgi:hypothetical protein
MNLEIGRPTIFFLKIGCPGNDFQKTLAKFEKQIFIARVATALPPLAPVLFGSLTGTPPCRPQHPPSNQLPPPTPNPLPPQVPDLSSSPLAAAPR